MSKLPALLPLFASVSLATAGELKPLLAQPDQIVLRDDFTKAAPIDKKQWVARQGTQWAIADGVLRGTPSTPDYQASHKDHKGYEPRISSPVTPTEFIAQFSVRFSGGSETAIVPFIEFGHHICRLRLSKSGAELLADHESIRVAESKDLRFEFGKWYHALAEMKGGEFVIQFDGGPTLYAKQTVFAESPASGGNGLGIAGPQGGTAELDDVTIWSVKAEKQTDWATRRAALPKCEPVTLVKKSAK
jgi:hypothetical protein